jgi:hypothetical protein
LLLLLASWVCGITFTNTFWSRWKPASKFAWAVFSTSVEARVQFIHPEETA